MTADQRLDQLEPLVSQTLAVADRHTAQLRQISITVSHLQEAVGQLLEAGQVQSDNIQFVLRELSEMRQEIHQKLLPDLDVVKHQTYGIQQNQSLTSTRLGDLENAVTLVGSQVSGLDAKVSGLDAKVAGLDAKVSGLDAKMDQVLGLLSGNK
jgi:phage shock protein A